MQLTKLLQKDYSRNHSGYQLKLPLNIETIIPDDDSVRLLSQFVEAMDLTDLYSTYERINSVSPRTLLKIVLYSYMNGDDSSRSMGLNCKRDINFMFLLEGAQAPDHSTFARFRSLHFAPCSKRILAEMSNALFDLGEISGETIFIDGTKIEAGANKYTFVWKKAVTKNQDHFLICFLALLFIRLLEKKLDKKYTCSEILNTLKEMNFADIEEQGYMPLYSRTKLTDALHEVCGFRTDYQFILKKKMRSIQKESKGR